MYLSITIVIMMEIPNTLLHQAGKYRQRRVLLVFFLQDAAVSKEMTAEIRMMQYIQEYYQRSAMASMMIVMHTSMSLEQMELLYVVKKNITVMLIMIMRSVQPLLTKYLSLNVLAVL